jgi:hypothetical protein
VAGQHATPAPYSRHVDFPDGSAAEVWLQDGEVCLAIGDAEGQSAALTLTEADAGHVLDVLAGALRELVSPGSWAWHGNRT